MARLRLATIVEGSGEVQALPVLLQRIWRDVIGGEFLDIVRPPLRGKRDRLIVNKKGDLERYLGLARVKLKVEEGLGDPQAVLILLDAERDEVGCRLGPAVLEKANQLCPDLDVSCVIADPSFETWFVAAATSLDQFIKVPVNRDFMRNPDVGKQGKGWIKTHFRGVKYAETVDQSKMAAAMDLTLCRENSPSFDKLCRELEKRATAK